MLETSNIAARQLLPRAWRLALLSGILAVGFLSAQDVFSQDAAPRFVQELPEAGDGKFYKCDLQHRFSDHELTATQFVARAVDKGCEIVIVTPPRPTDIPTALTRFLDEATAAQKAFPKTIVLPGYSWSIRAAGISGRATILLPPGPDFPSRFVGLSKQFVKPGSETSTAEALSQSLQNLCPDDLPVDQWPVILFDQFRDGTTLHRWSVDHLGHDKLWPPTGQQSRPLRGQFGLLDRWDQSDVRSGAEWDQLLADGWNAWAAADDLDLVLETSRYQPGELSETFLRLPEFTASQVLQSLGAGAFYGVRGGVARDVELSVSADGLPRPALAGETIDLPEGTSIRVRLSLTVPDVDWKKSPNRLDGVELIAVTPENSRMVQKSIPHAGRVTMEYETEIPPGGVLFRALGYRVIKEGGDYSFYTNPIRVLANGKWERQQVEVVREKMLFEEATLLIAGLLVAFSVAAVGGWLAATGKMSLLLGDLFQPVIRFWRSSKLYRKLARIAPSLIGRGDYSSETLGTSLAAHELQAILATLIGGSALLGGFTGFLAWPTELISIPFLPGWIAGLLCGAAVGAAIGAIGRDRPSWGMWCWVIALTVTIAVPHAGLDRALPSLLAMALMASVASEPLRTGVTRWPAEFPAGGIFCVLGLTMTGAALATAAPLPWSGVAGLLGPIATVVWVMFNVRDSRGPLRMLAISLLMLLWFGGRVSPQVGSAEASWLSAWAACCEAIGVGALWFVARPNRWDAIRVWLIAPAVGVLFVVLRVWYPLEVSLFLPAAFLAVLMLYAADSSLLANLGSVAAALVLGRALLFSPDQPGAWLLGSAAGLSAALAHKSSLRMCLLLLPYVLVGGYLSLEHSEIAASASPFGSYVALIQQAAAGLRADVTAEADFSTTTGHVLCLFSLAGLTALAWSVRDPRRLDVFDAAGRTSLAALGFAGVMLLLSVPLPGSVLLALSPPLGLWAANLVLVKQHSPQPDTVPLSESLCWRRWRTRLGIAAAVVAGLLAYGSLVPFQWRDMAWTDAVQAFLDQLRREHVWTKINSDRIVNVLLTVPLAACAYGAMVLGRGGFLARLWAIFETLQLSFVISVLVEMAQKWSVGRVASVEDVIAQALGAVIGIVVWIAVGERFVLRWAASDRMQTNEGRWEQVLAAYLLGVVVLAALPVGMPVTSPKQLYDRYRDGYLSLVPFADAKTWDQLLRDAVVGVVLFIPAGLWAAIVLRKPGTSLRWWGEAVGLGAGIASLITVLRTLCSSEATDSSWLLTGFAGSAIGAAFMLYQTSRQFDIYANWKSGVAWWCLSLLFAAILAGNLLHPMVFDASPEAVAANWKKFFNTPFASFHSGDDWNLIEEVLRKLAWFMALGMLFGQSVSRTTELRTGRIIGGVLSVLLAVAIAGGIEFAQTYQSHRSPEITDVLIYCIGAVLGLWIRFGWLNENMIDELPDSTFQPAATPMESPSWIAVLQTTIAVGLLLALLSGLALLFLRR